MKKIILLLLVTISGNVFSQIKSVKGYENADTVAYVGDMFFTAFRVNNKWGLLSNNEELILKPEYGLVDAFKIGDYYYLIAINSNGIEILTEQGKSITNNKIFYNHIAFHVPYAGNDIILNHKLNLFKILSNSQDITITPFGIADEDAFAYNFKSYEFIDGKIYISHDEKYQSMDPYYRFDEFGTRIDSIQYDVDGNMKVDAYGNPLLIFPPPSFAKRAGVLDMKAQKWLIAPKYAKVIYNKKNILAVEPEFYEGNNTSKLDIYSLKFKTLKSYTYSDIINPENCKDLIPFEKVENVTSSTSLEFGNEFLKFSSNKKFGIYNKSNFSLRQKPTTDWLHVTANGSCIAVNNKKTGGYFSVNNYFEKFNTTYDSIKIIPRNYGYSNIGWDLLLNNEHFEHNTFGNLVESNSISSNYKFPYYEFGVKLQYPFLTITNVTPQVRFEGGEPYFRYDMYGTRIDSVVHDANGNVIFNDNGMPLYVYPAPIPPDNLSGVFNVVTDKCIVPEKYAKIIPRNDKFYAIKNNLNVRQIDSLYSFGLYKNDGTCIIDEKPFYQIKQNANDILNFFGRNDIKTIETFHSNDLAYMWVYFAKITTHDNKKGLFDLLSAKWVLEPIYDEIIQETISNCFVTVRNNLIGIVDYDGFVLSDNKNKYLTNYDRMLICSENEFYIPNCTDKKKCTYSINDIAIPQFNNREGDIYHPNDKMEFKWVNNKLVYSKSTYTVEVQPEVPEWEEGFYKTIKKNSSMLFDFLNNKVTELKDAKDVAAFNDGYLVSFEDGNKVYNKNLNLDSNYQNYINPTIENGFVFCLQKTIYGSSDLGELIINIDLYDDVNPIYIRKAIVNGKLYPEEDNMSIDGYIDSKHILISEIILNDNRLDSKYHWYNLDENKYIKKNCGTMGCSSIKLTNGYLVDFIDSIMHKLIRLNNNLDTLSIKNHERIEKITNTFADNGLIHTYNDEIFYNYNNNGELIQTLPLMQWYDLSFNPNFIVNYKDSMYYLIDKNGQKLIPNGFHDVKAVHIKNFSFMDGIWDFPHLILKFDNYRALYSLSGVEIYRFNTMNDSIYFDSFYGIDGGFVCYEGNKKTLFKLEGSFLKRLFTEDLITFKTIGFTKNKNQAFASVNFGATINEQYIFDNEGTILFKAQNIDSIGEVLNPINIVFFTDKKNNQLCYYNFSNSKVVKTEYNGLPYKIIANPDANNQSFVANFKQNKFIINVSIDDKKNIRIQKQLAKAIERFTVIDENIIILEINKMAFVYDLKKLDVLLPVVDSKYQTLVGANKFYLFKHNANESVVLYNNAYEQKWIYKNLGVIIDSMKFVTGVNDPENNYNSTSIIQLFKKDRTAFYDNATDYISGFYFNKINLTSDYQYLKTDNNYFCISTRTPVFANFTGESSMFGNYIIGKTKNDKIKYYYIPTKTVTANDFEITSQSNYEYIVVKQNNKLAIAQVDLNNTLTAFKYDSLDLEFPIKAYRDGGWYILDSTFKEIGNSYKRILNIRSYNDEILMQVLDGKMYYIINTKGKIKSKSINPYYYALENNAFVIYKYNKKIDGYLYGIIEKDKIIVQPTYEEVDTSVSSDKVYAGLKIKGEWLQVLRTNPVKIVKLE